VAVFDFRKGNIGFVLGGRYPHCHTVVVDDVKKALIDAASDKEKLLAFHRQNAVDILITSHAHEDHIMYNALFPKAKLWVHELDAPAFSNVRSLTEQYGLSEEETTLWEEFLVKECNFVARAPDRLLKDGEVLEFGQSHAVTIHTPGHTPGHCCFHFPDEKVLFLADYDLVKAGPYYGDISSDIEGTIWSLKELATIEVDTYLTAHGKGIYEGSPELILNYLDIIFQREERLLDVLSDGPKTLDEITQVGIIYGNRSKVIGLWDLSISERIMMHKHLERLVSQQKVFEENRRYHLGI
jgi:hydroxyacylglutathione hydrolase